MTDKPNDWRERFSYLWDNSPYLRKDEVVAFIQSEMERVRVESKDRINALRAYIGANCNCDHNIGTNRCDHCYFLDMDEAQAKSGGEAK